MPACGLTPASLQSGVPASAPGLVLDVASCGDPSAFDNLAVRDELGQPVGFNLARLPDGSLLVSLTGGLTPGNYTIGIEPDLVGDEDAGSDVDAAVPMTEPELEQPQSVEVETAVRPTRFGEISRVNGECGALLELVPDQAVLPFAGVLAIDLQIDRGAVLPLVVVGTFKLTDGVMSVGLPPKRSRISSCEGEPELAGKRCGSPARTCHSRLLLTLNVPCGGSSEDPAYYGPDDSEASRWARWAARTAAAQQRRASAVLALYALRNADSERAASRNCSGSSAPAFVELRDMRQLGRA